MKSNFWFSKVLSKSTLTAMAALFMLSYGNVAYAAGPDMNIQAKQTKKVTGTVVDPSGEPMIGATVIEKGTSNGVVTDFDGNFAIDVPEGATIVISCIGFNNQEFPVAGKSVINVTLQDDAQDLDELVVVGYGVMKKRDVTGSIAQAKGSDIVKSQSFSALDGLRGKAAGVNIFSNSSQPGAYQNTVIIRGMSTINASTDPLYVVDGVVMEDFSMVNPNDIENIEVLKDASAAAIYGARGANGVILVTTKRGLENGEGTQISYAGSVSAATPARYMKTLSAQQWCDAWMIGLENENKWYGANWSLDPTYWFNDSRYFNPDGTPKYDTNWQKEATQTAISHNHQLNIQQAGKTSKVGAFLNYTDQQGIVINTYSKRINGKVTYDANPTSWLSTNVNLMVNHTWGRYTVETGGDQTARRTMIEFMPWMPVYNPDGTFTMRGDWANVPTNGFESMANPVAILTDQHRYNYNTQIFGNAALTFHLLPGLDLKTQYGVDAHNRTGKFYSSVTLENQSKPDGSANRSHTNTFYWQEETYLTYNKQFNENHRLNAMLGLSWQERTYDYDYMKASGFSGDDFYMFNNMGVATNRPEISSDVSSWRMNSYFVRAAYSLMNRYSLTATARYDGSSKFGANHKYAFFPSAGIAWNVKEEKFMQNVKAIDDLRIHTSYGITGNSEIGSYNSLTKGGAGTVQLNYSSQPYTWISSMPNPDLRWEKTAQWDLGFNLGVLNNRLRFDVSYYLKNTSDLLLSAPVPSQVGFSSIYQNIGSVRNQGVDIMVNATPVLTKDFSWDITLNANYNKNKVTKLANNDADIEYVGWVGGNEAIIRVGEPLGSFFGYTRYGIWDGSSNGEGQSAFCGDYDAATKTYANCNGRHEMGVSHHSKNKSIIGKGIPDWTGSFINNFRYKNFDLTVDMQFVYGVQTMRQYYHSTYDRFALTSGLEKILTDAWSETNKNTMEQAILLNGSGHKGHVSTVDSQWICDGSYLRANLIQLGYTFGKNTCNKLGLANARIYAAVNNAFLICAKDFDGYDPEASSERGYGARGQNMAFFSYPRARTYTVGINVTLGNAQKAKKEVVYTQPETKYIEKVVEKVVEKPVVKEVTKEVYTGNGVHVVCFEVGKAELTAEAKAELDKVKGECDVVAYASPEGGADLNKTLSENRAKAVADYLASKGVKVNRTAGCGAPNAQSNRIAIVTVK